MAIELNQSHIPNRLSRFIVICITANWPLSILRITLEFDKIIFHHLPHNLVVKGIAIGVQISSSIPGPVKSDSMSPTVRHISTFYQSCVGQALSREDEPGTRRTLRRNTASIMMGLFFATNQGPQPGGARSPPEKNFAPPTKN